MRPKTLSQCLILGFCLLHMTAICWWTLPHSFGGMVFANANNSSVEAKLFQIVSLDGYPGVTKLLQKYIDITGSQQYWDFFAPQSPRFHQYLSVCQSIVADHEEGKISCKSKPLFSNLDATFEKNEVTFKTIGSNSSRLYRLTENLVNLDEPNLLNAFVSYYDLHRQVKVSVSEPAQLVLHQFELHPELKDLPKAGYRMDKVLLALP